MAVPTVPVAGPVRAVLFDMDGVLVDTEGFYNRRRAAYLREVGRPVERFDFSGSNDAQIWQELVPEDPALRDRLHAGYDRYRLEHPVDYAKLADPDVREVFRGLHECGMRCAIASSSYPNMIQAMIDATGIGERVDFWLSGTQCEEHKPSPEIYLRCMDALGVGPEECLVVEDSSTGIAAGVASGATVVAVERYASATMDQSAADVRIPCLRDILDVTGVRS